jgi:TldD protein
VAVSPAETESFWDDALLAAAGRMHDGDGHPLLFLEDREDLRLEAGPGGLQEAVHSTLRGLAVRGGHGGRFEAALSDPSPEDVRRVSRAIVGGRLLRPFPGSSGHRGDGEPRIDATAALGHLSQLVMVALRATGRAAASATGRWVAFDQRVKVARPGRGIGSDARSGRRVRLEVRVAARSGVGAAVGESVLRAGPVSGLGELAEQVAERALARAEARRAPSGRLPIAFAPGVGGVLIHELVGHALEADGVGRGASALAAATGLVAPSHVRIVDDPRRGRAAWRMDDEGERARAIALVRGGRVAGLLHDQRSAAAASKQPTGHGRRSSFQEPVRPRMGCTFLAPGGADPSEALEDIGRGVYVRRMEAASGDVACGTAMFRVTDADLIHRGHLDVPLKPFLLAVVTREALSSLDAIASDLEFDTCIGSCMRDGQPLATSVGAPTFKMGLTTVIP